VRRFLLFVALVALGAAAGYVIYLDRVVVSQFEGRRWSEPARVYAEPLEIYPGLALSADSFERELARLRYRKVEKLGSPGTYRRRGPRIDVAAREVRFWDEARPAQVIAVGFGASGVESIRNAKGAAVPIYRLDPLLIGSIFAAHGEDRLVLTPEEVPALLPAALKVVEDRKFDRHEGVDFEAIARAFVANVRAGEIEQGGSTLTQQLVRSYFLDNRQTLGRKSKEAIMAMLLEARFDKRDIMTAYVNEVYLGQDGRRAIHGFGLASQFYFGRSLEELDLEEMALLVAVVRGPSYYDPRRFPERVRQRRNLVLKLLGEFDVAPEARARAAMKAPLGVTGEEGPRPGYYPAFVDLVRRTLRRDYREEDITEAGLQIFTTLDPRVQSQAERALTEELRRLERSRRPATAEERAKGRLEGVVVVTAPASGDVVALVGGRETTLEGFNRALDARRPIGSLAKPIVYLTALETGRYHPASIVDDEPIEVRLRAGKVWRPRNLSGEANGPVPLVRALAQSMNLATVRLGLDVGVPGVARKFEQLGLAEKPQAVPAMLLGAVSASPLEVAQVYNALANGGFRVPLRAVRAVLDGKGERLKAFELETEQAASPEAVYELNRMLVQAVDRGTAQAARATLPPALVVAGKTGTSSEYRDSWFAGFSGSHVAAVWIGYDDNRPTGLTGASGALTVWAKLMARIDTTSWQAPLPESLEELWIDYATGYAADPQCAEDVVIVALPKDADISIKPGCGTALDELATRAREWLRRVLQ
jgi:penicillin-binding protein 1B